jgi:hypothetical protein
MIQCQWRQRRAREEVKLRIEQRRRRRADNFRRIRLEQEAVSRDRERRIQEIEREEQEVERQNHEKLDHFLEIDGMAEAALMAQKMWRGLAARRTPIRVRCEICVDTILSGILPQRKLVWASSDMFALNRLDTPNGDLLRDSICQHNYCVGCVRNYLVSECLSFQLNEKSSQ